MQALPRLAAMIASLGLLLPPPLTAPASAAEAARRPSRGRPDASHRAVRAAQRVRDVRLDRDGGLRGVVFDAAGHPLIDAPVTAFCPGRTPAAARTDATGRFRMPAMAGGLWCVQCGPARSVFRVWADRIAPPAAGATAVLQMPRTVVRGQSDRGYRLTTDGVLLGAVLLGGAAVPVIVDRGGSDPPSGS